MIEYELQYSTAPATPGDDENGLALSGWKIAGSCFFEDKSILDTVLGRQGISRVLPLDMPRSRADVEADPGNLPGSCFAAVRSWLRVESPGFTAAR